MNTKPKTRKVTMTLDNETEAILADFRKHGIDPDATIADTLLALKKMTPAKRRSFFSRVGAQCGVHNV